MRYLYKRRFLDAFDALAPKDKDRVRAAERLIRQYHKTRKAPYGLRIKRLHERSGEALYEARASLALRLLWAERQNLAAFLIVGSHDDIRRYLRAI